jgi:hypothetical protein
MMRNIPKLAAAVGAVTIGILGFQGVAAAGTHSGSTGGQSKGYSHETWPAKTTSYWWYQHPKPPYPGEIKPPPKYPTPPAPPQHNYPFPIVYYRYPTCVPVQVSSYPGQGKGNQDGKGSGYKLLTVDHNTGHGHG